MDFIQPGRVVLWGDRKWVIIDFAGLDRVVIRPMKGSRSRQAPAAELIPVQGHLVRPNVHTMSAEAWNKAWRIFEGIEPLTRFRRNSAKAVTEAAANLNVSTAQVYNYLALWKRYKRVSAFTRKVRSDKGKSRLQPEVQEIIKNVIDTFFLVPERPTEAETVLEVRRLCAQAQLPLPSATPVLAAIRAIPERERARAHLGSKRARERFDPYRGSFPGADFPLAVVQVDHTPADVILVDEETRRAIGRPTLTVLIDVCTRMIQGFFISLEAPSALSAAMALQHAILPKDQWLRERGLLDLFAKYGFDDPWPIWGRPRKVHADNASEFRGNALKRGCMEYGITLEHRPKGLPQYGGAIERSFRSFMGATQRLKGTTFSNVYKKVDYDSERRAILTLKEYERWFTIFVVTRYHQKRHQGIQYPPINLYRRFILGDSETPPMGLPEPEADPHRLLIDFLPYFERSIQQQGVAIGNIHYWDDSLRRWIGAKDPTSRAQSRKFIFARDPRDLSHVYFLDPDTNMYFPIPYRNRARPPISYWEHAAAQRLIAKDPNRKPNEEMIFQGIALARELEAEADKKTKQVRKMKARRQGWDQAQRKAADSPFVRADAILTSSANRALTRYWSSL